MGSVNGSANGSSNGSANGSSNGSANGSSNGSSNGSANGSTNGSANGSAREDPDLERQVMEVKLPRSVNTVLGKNSSAYWCEMLFAAFLLGFGLYFTSGELGAMESSNSLALAALYKNKRNLFLPVFSSAFVFFSLVYCLVKNDDEKEPDRQERTSKRAEIYNAAYRECSVPCSSHN